MKIPYEKNSTSFVGVAQVDILRSDHEFSGPAAKRNH